MSNNYHYQTITELSNLIKEQKLSPVELVTECLARIEKLNPELNAFITVTSDQALADAKQAEEEIKAGTWRGPLHGIPVALKDMYDTAGIKTTAAFKYFKDRTPKEDAAVVTKLKEAGAVIVGKTNMHELAMGTTSTVSAFGPVHNPWDQDYIAGGSSGGSAVAVASGMCFATIDTDAIGSTRLPAAACGVVGYKCTWGLIDNTGVLAGERADEVILKLATVGIITRGVADTALVADILAARDKKFVDALQKKTEQRIGVVTNYEASSDIRTACNDAIDALKKLGFQTGEIEAPFDPNPNMAKIDDSRKTADKDIFKDVDVLVLPTTASDVPKIKDVGANPQAFSPQNTFFANYFGLPAISVPCGNDANGLPIGLQIVGKTGEDCSVMQIALAYQNATDWHKQHPTK